MGYIVFIEYKEEFNMEFDLERYLDINNIRKVGRSHRTIIQNFTVWFNDIYGGIIGLYQTVCVNNYVHA